MLQFQKELIKNIEYTLYERGVLGVVSPSGKGVVNLTKHHINSKGIKGFLIDVTKLDTGDLDMILRESNRLGEKEFVLILMDTHFAVPGMAQHWLDMIVNHKLCGKKLNIMSTFLFANEPIALYDTVVSAGVRNFGEYKVSAPCQNKTLTPYQEGYNAALRVLKGDLPWDNLELPFDKGSVEQKEWLNGLQQAYDDDGKR